ncbi:helix-turn-helix domain-containing protein [Oceanobacillus massiliensis]|uniref:helix-turn-helix domain-containing protein n=1 Tax=Oceanobacillus massiliensis TaxID=1465765 RepID=UPI00028A17D4|nr:helix-turn-helix domain-containing protein [Oceanobacillus massiliensis]
MDVGAKLKEARLASGLSLDSLQETTKIQKRYLLAIEEGNLHILPGKFYARAFIKEYANAVGLDSNELLEEYKEEIPSTEEENVQYTRMQRTRKEQSTDKGPGISSVIPMIIVALLIIGIVAVTWWFIRENTSENGSEPVEEPQDNNVIITNPDNTGSDSGDENQSEEGATDAEETDTDEENSEDGDASDDPEEEPSEAEITVAEEGTGQSPESTLELNDAPDEVIITLESSNADDHTWLEIRNEGTDESLYNADFNAETSPVELDVSDAEAIYFNVGNAPALNILINGEALEYPVDISKVHQRLHLNINKAE